MDYRLKHEVSEIQKTAKEDGKVLTGEKWDTDFILI